MQRVDEINARTDPLRRLAGRGNTETLSRSGNLGKSRKPGSERKARIDEIVGPSSCPTEPLAGMQIQETAILTPEKAQLEADESFGMFSIQKCILLIHTDKVVQAEEKEKSSDVVNQGKGVKKA
ncbi:MAG TPA: hypothetical protein H9858_06020 [Candidatus Blautia stercoravium]|nr:hypothetical protein [Candidatus Blautia stercoravium]